MIREKTPQELAATHFASAGLGSRSASAAARLLCESGLSFETAAVMGQRMDEPCTATAASIREAAHRYRRVIDGPRSATPYGRPVQETTAVPDPALGTSTPVDETAARGNGAAVAKTAWGRPVTEQNRT